ncbi:MULTISPECIES: PLP-dependent aspartate aminotransferase family protein [Micromonospora]|uniref:PLP-dependent transferase n=1 Tax=Micromonospora solifontis TaxID=2487138 RepID=A0ABX9WEE0_9ACTN|nr:MULTISPECIES: PLP-dependent aspartate aminotransferase family protein [Micromonospora]NES12179.1 PLP-dependent transferase [Micromonospora sp. PPF5-17B]NES37903.1 PLP-dependent transferase [Micromonospora solifontis]NES54338.1 PLP-dependent transferase [Micromonospora sp. PPF5-6]RNL97829.1 PLP-dependent transferase [Micromonospora solifontis]
MTSVDTRAVHAGRDDLAGLGVHVPPIDLSTTNPLPSVTDGGDAYETLATGGTLPAGASAVYQRLWNPTVARFETALAELEGTAEAVAFASGMAALTATLLAATRDGKRHIVAVRPLYGGTDHVLATGLLGTEVTWARPDQVAAAVRPDTALVVVETPANPTLDLVDIAALAAAGHAPLLVDNTVATPVLQQPARHGAALVLHSATKSIGGHGDVLAGAVACDATWATRLRQVRAVTGAILHPLGAYLLHRGLQTLPLRVRAQQAGAEKIAAWLAGHPAVERVHHPSLHDPAGLVGRQLSGTGSLLAFEVRGGAPAAAAVAGACQLITHAVSLGGVDTLIQHPASLTHRPVEGDAKPGGGLLRVSVGLEDPEDLRADLERALSVI